MKNTGNCDTVMQCEEDVEMVCDPPVDDCGEICHYHVYELCYEICEGEVIDVEYEGSNR